jgi:hypothetical protein
VRRLALLLAFVVAAGCSDSVTDPVLNPTDANIAGTYNLATANGHLLPIVARLTADDEWDITSDQIVIAADSTWTETTNYRITTFGTGVVSTQAGISSGTYSIANRQINFIMTVGGTATFTGSVTGNNLSLLFNGGQFSYTK